MQPLLPPLGLRGVFKLEQPLDSILNPNLTYTVFGIESINKLLTDGIDVKTIIYVNQGLTIDDYMVDLENNTISIRKNDITVANIARVLQKVGAKPNDIIEILQTIKRAGAITAQLKVI